VQAQDSRSAIQSAWSRSQDPRTDIAVPNTWFDAMEGRVESLGAMLRVLRASSQIAGSPSTARIAPSIDPGGMSMAASTPTSWEPATQAGANSMNNTAKTDRMVCRPHLRIKYYQKPDENFVSFLQPPSRRQFRTPTTVAYGSKHRKRTCCMSAQTVQCFLAAPRAALIRLNSSFSVHHRKLELFQIMVASCLAVRAAGHIPSS
jgi:hypothetical protein